MIDDFEETFEAMGAYELIIGANENNYIADEPGLYQLVVTRTRNRDSVKGKSIEYRVTNAPAVPTYVEGVYDGLKIIPVQSLEYGREIMTIEWNNNIESDEFYVTWYLYRGDKNMEDLELATFKISDAYISNFNPIEKKYSDIITSAGEDVEGYYYGIVKNKLNGVESAYSERPEQINMFSVTGS